MTSWGFSSLNALMARSPVPVAISRTVSGEWLAGGVWLLDLVILYLSMLILYRMARLFTDERNGLLITTLLGGLAQLPFTDEGSPEWLVMPGCIYSA